MFNWIPCQARKWVRDERLRRERQRPVRTRKEADDRLYIVTSLITEGANVQAFSLSYCMSQHSVYRALWEYGIGRKELAEMRKEHNARPRIRLEGFA